jgi:hypothetical protein
MAKKQKILYLTISDLKELGLLKKKSKRSKNRKKKYYVDAKGQVRSTYVAPSSSNASYGLISGPATERSNNLLSTYETSINDINRFKIATNNKFQQAEDLYNNKVVPLINKTVGSTLGKTGGSDTFTHSSNTAKPVNNSNRFQLNDQPATIRNVIQNPSWEETQEKLNKELREADVIKELQLKQIQLKQIQMKQDQQNHNQLVTPIKPHALRGNKDVIVEDVEDNEDELKVKEEVFSHTDNAVYKNSRAKKEDLPKWKTWYEKIQRKKKEQLDPYIMNNNSDRGDVTKVILKSLRNEYKQLGGTDNEQLHEPNPNIIHKKIREMKHYRKAKPFEDNNIEL